MERFGEKLRALRHQKGMTQNQLGDILEVSQSYIVQLETGKKTPNVALVVKLSELFNVSADVLIKDYLELD